MTTPTTKEAPAWTSTTISSDCTRDCDYYYSYNHNDYGYSSSRCGGLAPPVITSPITAVLKTTTTMTVSGASLTQAGILTFSIATFLKTITVSVDFAGYINAIISANTTATFVTTARRIAVTRHPLTTCIVGAER